MWVYAWVQGSGFWALGFAFEFGVANQASGKLSLDCPQLRYCLYKTPKPETALDAILA